MADASIGTPPPEEEGPFQGLRNWFRQLRKLRDGDTNLRTSLAEMIEEHDEEEPIDPQERRLLRNILTLHDATAADLMVPRVDIVAIDISTPFAEVVRQAAEHGHSRIPVYRENLDDVVGMIHVKDLLPYAAEGKTVPLEEILRAPLFVAPSMPVLDLLAQMRQQRTHQALVIDEFGGIDGLVTIEDVIEEIVGEIEDEHDDAGAPTLIERADGTFIADGRTPIEDLQERTSVRLLSDDEEEEVDTLGGLVFTLAGRVPARGEVIKHPSGVEFDVLDADPRRVKRIRIRGLPRIEVVEEDG